MSAALLVLQSLCKFDFIIIWGVFYFEMLYYITCIQSARKKNISKGRVVASKQSSGWFWNRNTAYIQWLLRLLATTLPLLLKRCVSIHYSIFRFKSVPKYFPQGILVTQFIFIYDF